jgi:hypothetical protein
MAAAGIRPGKTVCFRPRKGAWRKRILKFDKRPNRDRLPFKSKRILGDSNQHGTEGKREKANRGLKVMTDYKIHNRLNVQSSPCHHKYRTSETAA